EVTAKEVPELDDEYVQDISEFDTVDAYKEDVKKNIADRKEAQARRTKEEEAIAKIVDKSKMDIPDAMIDTQVNSMINEYANSMRQSGLSFEQYLQFTGMTVEKFREQVRPDALDRIKSSLVLEQIAKEESIEVSDEDVDARIAEIAEQYGMPAENLQKNIPASERKEMKKEIAMQKALEFVMDNVKERAKAKKKAEKEEAAE
ncbi:MAG: trigger factor, partial [Lachnospiraceae bacterium]|nr:trigger factor [Lachnospiraceae bacterium]